MQLNGVKLRLALSQNGSLLCTAHNRGSSDASLTHSNVLHHTDLFIFDKDGKSVAFADRTSDPSTSAKDKKGLKIPLPPDERVHLSHSRLIFDSDGTWGITWGRMRYRGIKRGIYRFITSHPETLASNIATFDINPISSVIKEAKPK